MKSPIKHRWLVCALALALLGVSGAGFAQSLESLDKRLTLIERKVDNAALGGLFNELESLRQQVQNLRGEIELLRHQLEETKERQRNIYSDIDTRLRKLEQGATGAASSGEPQPNPSSSSMQSSQADRSAPGAMSTLPSESVTGNVSLAEVTPEKASQASDGGKAAARRLSSLETTGERAAYEQAFNTLREGRYARSQRQFAEFLREYPDGHYGDNARYWLGESYYAQRQFDQAMEQFQKVLENFPHSTKRAGAQLKIGFIQYEQGKLDQARKTLGKVIQRYPDSTVASLAQQRLRLIDEGDP
ncbi:MAG: tol-pal system protein YbgF [Nitrococcus sp.]|nr:tol-pal system protein YbgF [Nitrococcus sp.]